MAAAGAAGLRLRHPPPPTTPCPSACRLSGVACVDRRMCSWAAAPSLLRSLDVELDGTASGLSSFFGWLAAVAAPHVESLALTIDLGQEEASQYVPDAVNSLYSDAALAALLAGLRAFGAEARKLTTLQLELLADFTLTGEHCGALPPSLRRLEVTCCCAGEAEAELYVSARLYHLAALEHLSLGSDYQRFEPDLGQAPSVLPPALTSLALGGFNKPSGMHALPKALRARVGLAAAYRMLPAAHAAPMPLARWPLPHGGSSPRSRRTSPACRPVLPRRSPR